MSTQRDEDLAEHQEDAQLARAIASYVESATVCLTKSSCPRQTLCAPRLRRLRTVSSLLRSARRHRAAAAKTREINDVVRNLDDMIANVRLNHDACVSVLTRVQAAAATHEASPHDMEISAVQDTCVPQSHSLPLPSLRSFTSVRLGSRAGDDASSNGHLARKIGWSRLKQTCWRWLNRHAQRSCACRQWLAAPVYPAVMRTTRPRSLPNKTPWTH